MPPDNEFITVDIPGLGERRIPANTPDDKIDSIVKQIINLERGENAGAPIDVPTNENITPQPRIASDIPTDENLAPTLQAPERTLGSKIMEKVLQVPQNIIGATEALGTLGSGFLSTAGGTLAGIAKEPFTGEPAEQTAQRIQQGLTYTPRTEAGQKITQDVVNAMSLFEGLPPYAPVPSKFGIRKPSIGKVPSQEKLGLQAQKFYDAANKSGVQFRTEAFKDKMIGIAKDLRSEGYTPKAFTTLSSAFEEGAFSKFPRDFTEVQSIRAMFKNAASVGGSEGRLAMKALDKFDDYMINAPESDFVVAGKKGLESWKQARTAYSKMKKSELFEDMINNAELKTSEGGNLDRTLLNDLTALSKDKNKMKFFTPDERARIVKLVKSNDARGMVQRVFSMGGLMAPGFGSRAGQFKSALYTLGATGGGEPLTTGAIAGGTLLSRLAAEQMRKSGIRDLARFARSGGTEIAPGGKAYQIQLPTGSEYYGTSGLLSNVIDEENQ